MFTLTKTAKATIVAALSATALAVAPTAAMANGGNWALQMGPTGSGCYAWTTWTSNHVSAHVYQQAQNYDGSNVACSIEIQQYWRSNADSTGHEIGSTTATSTEASVPNNAPYDYYYYGPSGSDYLCVEVSAEGNGAPYSGWVRYGTGC